MWDSFFCSCARGWKGSYFVAWAVRTLVKGYPILSAFCDIKTIYIIYIIYYIYVLVAFLLYPPKSVLEVDPLKGSTPSSKITRCTSIPKHASSDHSAGDRNIARAACEKKTMSSDETFCLHAPGRLLKLTQPSEVFFVFCLITFVNPTACGSGGTGSTYSRGSPSIRRSE